MRSFSVRLRHLHSRELWRPYRACASLESAFPGRCPGLACCFPFGAEFQIAQHRYGPSRGLPFPVPTARAGPTPTGRASSDVAPLGRRPKGAVTNQPRATPWDHAKQPRPCPERAKQNAVFYVRLRHLQPRLVARARAFPFSLWNLCSQCVALGWHVVSPSRRNSKMLRQHLKVATKPGAPTFLSGSPGSCLQATSRIDGRRKHAILTVRRRQRSLTPACTPVVWGRGSKGGLILI